MRVSELILEPTGRRPQSQVLLGGVIMEGQEGAAHWTLTCPPPPSGTSPRGKAGGGPGTHSLSLAGRQSRGSRRPVWQSRVTDFSLAEELCPFSEALLPQAAGAWLFEKPLQG